MTQNETTQSETPAGNDEGREGYDVHAVQEKWLPVWDEIAPFRSGRPDDTRPKQYVLDMFPYPSGDLHMGHAEAYALGDVIARYWVQQGFNVMHPIGWDSFGLPAENAAIKRGADPVRWTAENIEQQKASMRRYACSFDWDRVLHTSDPAYYRWNQWLFLKMFERGLAYRKDSNVNWCPNDQTVLANEQVVQGRCERCDALVTKKKLTQWYMRITDYADRLLDDMAQLEGHWPEKVLLDAAQLDRSLDGRARALRHRGPRRAGDRLHDASRHAVRCDVLRRRGRLRPGGRAGRRHRGAGRLRGLPGDGQAGQRDRPAVLGAREDRRLPAAPRDQPGQRRAHPGLRRRLRAGRLRHRRDHGRARARPARLGLRDRLRPADRAGRAVARGLRRQRHRLRR